MTTKLNLNQKNECVLCSEAINTHLCHECLGKQIKTWLAYYPDIKKKVSPKINSFVNEVEDLIN